MRQVRRITGETMGSMMGRGVVAALAAAALSAAVAGGCSTGSSGTGGETSSSSSGTGATGGAGTGGMPGTGGTGGAGNTPQICTSNDDCAGDPKGHVCDPDTAQCVPCVPGGDGCTNGQFCDPATITCVTGCDDDLDCEADPNGFPHCDGAAHKCVLCVTDKHCLAGTICQDNTCVTGCTPDHDCPAGLTCCSGTCKSLSTDPKNCGSCDNACMGAPNTLAKCLNSMCNTSSCLPAYDDCNGDMVDGCEQNVLEDGSCTCVPGATQTCYQGAPGTLNVGACKAGTQTCLPSGTGWGACTGQVLPTYELCGDQIDQDCNGVVDDVNDIDGDGWTVCNGDCCEVPGPGCVNPKLVNPGAFEIVGNNVDDDCDPTTPDNTPPVDCSTQPNFAGVTGTDVAKAMDLCQFTTANAPIAQKKWGVISATQVYADGSAPSPAQLANMQNLQTAILNGYGSVIVPKKGPTFAGVSSGVMRDQGDAGFLNPNTGSIMSGAKALTLNALPSSTPLGYYVSKQVPIGTLPSGQCNNMACPTGTSANDSVDIRMVIRVPTNAKSFSYDFRFFSAEYQTFQCTSFNDYYLALLTSGVQGIPVDHNISFDALNKPVSVNNAFFEVCPGNGKNCNNCPAGTADLAGTGMQLGNTGGGTTWLTTDAPVVPGETITLDLMLFDVQDQSYDSIVILDNFRWSQQVASVGTHQ